MAKRRLANDWQLVLSFDAETLAAKSFPTDVPGAALGQSSGDVAAVVGAAPIGATREAGLPTDRLPPPEPERLSENTRPVSCSPDDQAPTVMAHGAGDAKMGQVFLEMPRSQGAGRLGIPASEPAPCVMADGIGDVNTSQYTLTDGDTSTPGSDKPPYRIPLMPEIAAVRKNGLRAISTFTGCGGSDLGLLMAGYDVIWGNEFVPAAQDTFRANNPETVLDTRDIRTVTGADIRKVIGDEDLDLFIGSPPCASFSTAGKGSKGWGQVRNYSDVRQRTDDLFEQYIRLVAELRPRAFVAENVAGMVKGVAIGFFNEYLAKMRTLPYNVEARLLDAQWLGVPQRRVRLIFIGVRKDVGRPAWPRKLPYRYSIREAIPWIGTASAKAHSESDWQKQEDRLRADKPSPTVPTGDSMGSFYGHEVERVDEVRVVGGNGAIGSAKGADVPLDAPAPTVLAGGDGPHGLRDRTDQFVVVEERQPRVIYDEGFPDTPPRDVTDAPAPTIKVGANGLCSTHFLVEGNGPADADTRVNRKDRGAVRDTDRSGSQFQHVAHSVDEPSVSIKATEAMQEMRLETSIEGSHGFDGHAPRSVDQPSETITNRTLSDNTQRPEVEPQSALGRAVGAEWDTLLPGEQSDKYLNLIRPHPDDVCPTVTQLGGTSAASVTHPLERRKFTIAELRRICGFPDDFILTGSYANQWERLGRAVPPPMMYAVAATLARDVFGKDVPGSLPESSIILAKK